MKLAGFNISYCMCVEEGDNVPPHKNTIHVGTGHWCMALSHFDLILRYLVWIRV